MRQCSHGAFLTGCAILFGSATWAATPGPLDPPFTSTVNLGFNDLAVGQPVVQAEVVDPDSGASLGPVFSQPFLLDTGATGIFIAGGTFYDLADFLNNGNVVVTNAATELTGAGLVIEGQVGELGVGGVQVVDVSKPYDVHVRTGSTLLNTVSDARMLVNGAANFGSFAGIIGMPAMVGKVTTLDMSVWSGGLGDFNFDLGDIDDYLDNLEQLETSGNMAVSIGSAVPAPASPDRRLSIPVAFKQFDYVNDPPVTQFTVPENAPLPFTSVTYRNGNAAPFTSHDVLIDTGAQISIINSQIAIAMGLDRNNDGFITADDLDPLDPNEQTITVSGVSGEVDAPVLGIDGMEIITEQGVKLTWSPYLLVLDIDEEIPAIFGADLITSGWSAVLLATFADLLGLPPGPTPTDGNFLGVHFDFRDLLINDPADATGRMYFDLAHAVPEPGVLVLIGLGSAMILAPGRRRKRR